VAPNGTAVIGTGDASSLRTLTVDRDFSTTSGGRVALFTGTITVTGGTSSIHGVAVQPDIKVTGGERDLVSSLWVDQPMSALTGAATVNVAASAVVYRAPTHGKRNFGLFVREGVSRFEGDGTHVFEFAEMTGTIATTHAGRIPVRTRDGNGDLTTRYIPYYDNS
jgi:hypothetical protein